MIVIAILNPIGYYNQPRSLKICGVQNATLIYVYCIMNKGKTWAPQGYP